VDEPRLSFEKIRHNGLGVRRLQPSGGQRQKYLLFGHADIF
jgi:hypothetical protein